MRMQRRSMARGWAGLLLAVALTGACSPETPPEPEPEQTLSVDPTTPSPVSISPTTEPTPTPTPTPSSTLSEEQTAAAETVMEFFRLKNELGQDPYLEFQPLANITTGQTQVLQMSVIDRYRVEELVQTGETEYYITSVGDVEGEQDDLTVKVQACTDATDVDLVEVGTGDSVLPAERAFFVEWDMDILHDGFSWKVGDIESGTVDRCGP